MPRVFAEYSGEPRPFEPPRHDGRGVVEVTHHAPVNGKYSPLPGRAPIPDARAPGKSNQRKNNR